MNTLLIKISGEIFSYNRQNKNSPKLHHSSIEKIVTQIKTLSLQHRIGIVIGGGNFFRGALDNDDIKLTPTTAHNIGMISTIVNGCILQDVFMKNDVSSTILSAFPCTEVGEKITQYTINKALKKNNCIIFVGGTGNPFFTTDTNAVLRALQINANQIWKATKVDGVYDSDPLTNKNAIFYSKISYNDVLSKGLTIMDRTAISLAQEHKIPIRVFNLFTPNALHKVLENPNFGSTITNN